MYSNEKLIARVEVFNDSSELANMLLSMSRIHRGPDAYYMAESATHISGLYELTKQLAKALGDKNEQCNQA